MMADAVAEIYKSVGGDEPFYRLVDEFYAGVEVDQILRPLYPSDLSDAKKHLALFLIQRTGGPQTYSLDRGHPRMRMRHMPFPIGVKERDAWIKNMFAALDKVDDFSAHRQVLRDYFAEFATFLINKPG